MKELDGLLDLYRGYLAEYAQRLEDNGPFHGLHKFLLGDSTPSDRKADSAFFRAVEQAVDALARALDGRPAAEAARAVRFMALEAEGVDPSSRLMMEAAQGLALPLVPLVPPEERAAIRADYLARYPKKRMLSPRQRELLAALEK